jgi:predicted transcriptional regulator YdeE
MFVVKELKGFSIIGISVRTINSNGKSLKDIGELFGRFVEQKLMDRIPDKESSDIYCVYTEYESDFNAPYTTIIGCRVGSFDHIPTGMSGIRIPDSKYQVYKSSGKLSECLAKTWVDIWESDINRKYAADFDIYGEKAWDPDNAEVDTFVSIV